jgi:hypothetical protein
MSSRQQPKRDDYDFVEIGGLRLNMAAGDDSAPLMNKVIDPAAGWGGLTSSGRTNSASFLAFVEKHKAAREAQEKKRRG